MKNQYQGFALRTFIAIFLIMPFLVNGSYAHQQRFGSPIAVLLEVKQFVVPGSDKYIRVYKSGFVEYQRRIEYYSAKHKAIREKTARISTRMRAEEVKEIVDLAEHKSFQNAAEKYPATMKFDDISTTTIIRYTGVKGMKEIEIRNYWPSHRPSDYPESVVKLLEKIRNLTERLDR
jgi:hypothetical protein